MKKLRFGVMGCASIAQRSILPAIYASELAEIACVGSRSESTAALVASRYGCRWTSKYESLLSDRDVDAIYMPLPSGIQFEWLLRALESGKHVLVEKSLCLNFDQVKSVVNLASKKKLLVMENLMFEFHSQQESVRSLIRSDLGSIRLFNAYFGFPPLSADNFRYNPSVGGGALIDAGAYVIASARVFFPEYEGRMLSACWSKCESGVDTSGTAFMQLLRSGYAPIPMCASYGFDNSYRCGIEVWGAKGLLQTDRTFTAKPDYSPKVRLINSIGDTLVSLAPDDHFVRIIDKFSMTVFGEYYTEEYNRLINQASLLNDFRILAAGD
jgi:dTDP-3,4-didehydro-2,6-dideoxy-alpha-D-glucose 3-reductase